jgi:hypothetical protein
MGIRPWEIDLMTVEQFDQAVLDIDEHIRQLNKHSD